MAGFRHKQKFTVYINEGEKHQIHEWVKRYPNIETGGDLFGAWIDDHTAVVQFVLGPGNNCYRTGASFYQDVDYLRDAGSFLTQQHGLCNIGQWHSHHQLGLTRPSGGDENTVWSNMPKLGLNRYIVFIATITGGSRSYFGYGDYYGSSSNKGLNVNINPYLFEIKHGRRMDVLHGSFESMKYNSPFRLNEAITDKMQIGAEVMNRIKRYEITVEKDRKRSYDEIVTESTEPKTKQLKPKEKEEGEYSDRTEDAENDSDVNGQDEQSGQSNIQPERGGDNDVLDEKSVINPTTHEDESKQKQPGTTVSDEISTSKEEATEQESLKNKTETEQGVLTGDNFPDSQSSTPQGDRSNNNDNAEGNSDEKSTPATLTSNEDENEGEADDVIDMDTDTSLPSDIPKEIEQDRPTYKSNTEDLNNDDNDKNQLKPDNGTALADEDLPRKQGMQSNIQHEDGTENLPESSEKHESDEDQVKSDTGDVSQDEKSAPSNIPQGKGSDSNAPAEDGLDDNSKEEATEQESLKNKTETEQGVLTGDNFPDSQSSTPQRDRSNNNDNAEGNSDEKSTPATLTSNEDENEGEADDVIDMDTDMDTDTSLPSDIPKEIEQDRPTYKLNTEDLNNDDNDKNQLKPDNGTALADEDLPREQGMQSNIQHDDRTENLQESSEKCESDEDQVESDTGDVSQNEKRAQSNIPQGKGSDSNAPAEDGLDDNSKPTSPTSHENDKSERRLDSNNDDDRNGTVSGSEDLQQNINKNLQETSQIDSTAEGFDERITHGESDADAATVSDVSGKEQNGLSSIPRGNVDITLTKDLNDKSELTAMTKEDQDEQKQPDTMITNSTQELSNETQEDSEQDPSRNIFAGMDDNEKHHGEADDADGQSGQSNIRPEDAENDLKHDSNEDSQDHSIVKEETDIADELLKRQIKNSHGNCEDITTMGLNGTKSSDKGTLLKSEDQNTDENFQVLTVKDPKDSLNGTQVESMEVDNQDPSSEDRATHSNENLGKDEQGEQPIQMSENQPKTLELEVLEVIDSNTCKLMSQDMTEDMNESYLKQSLANGSQNHSVTKSGMDPANAINDRHTKSDQENNDDAVFNDSRPENSFVKTKVGNMDIDGQNYSAEDKATDFDENMTGEDTKDHDQNGMMKLQNKRSDTTVKHAEELEEESEQPIQKSENQPKTPEWGDVEDILKSITKELKTPDIDNNESKLMSQEENDDLIKRQEREDPMTKGHEERVFKNMMDDQTDDNPTTLQPSTAAEATVQPTVKLEKQSEQLIQKSENQPKTLEWGEVDGILNSISQKREDPVTKGHGENECKTMMDAQADDNLTTSEPCTSARETDHLDRKTDEKDLVSPAVDIKIQVDDDSNKNQITMNGGHDVDKTLVSDKAVERRSRSIFDRLPNDEQQSESNNRKSEAEVKTDEIHKTKNQRKDSQDNKQKPSEIVKKNEFGRDIAVESISSDGENNRGITNESQKKDDYDASDVKVHSAEAAEIPAAEEQQIGRIENLSGKKESIIPESTKQLESSNDQEKIGQQEKEEKEVKKLEEEQKVIDASKMSANKDDNSKIVTPHEQPHQSSMGDSMDAVKAVESNDGHAQSNTEDEVNDDKEPVNHCSCFSFLSKRKKRNQMAKGKRTETKDRDSSNDREKIEQQGKEEKKVKKLEEEQKVIDVSKMSAHKDDDSKSGTPTNLPDQPKQTKGTTDNTKVEESNDGKKKNKGKGTTDVPKTKKKKIKRNIKEDQGDDEEGKGKN